MMTWLGPIGRASVVSLLLFCLVLRPELARCADPKADPEIASGALRALGASPTGIENIQVRPNSTAGGETGPGPVLGTVSGAAGAVPGMADAEPIKLGAEYIPVNPLQGGDRAATGNGPDGLPVGEVLEIAEREAREAGLPQNTAIQVVGVEEGDKPGAAQNIKLKGLGLLVAWVNFGYQAVLWVGGVEMVFRAFQIPLDLQLGYSQRAFMGGAVLLSSWLLDVQNKTMNVIELSKRIGHGLSDQIVRILTVPLSKIRDWRARGKGAPSPFENLEQSRIEYDSQLRAQITNKANHLILPLSRIAGLSILTFLLYGTTTTLKYLPDWWGALPPFPENPDAVAKYLLEQGEGIVTSIKNRTPEVLGLVKATLESGGAFTLLRAKLEFGDEEGKSHLISIPVFDAFNQGRILVLNLLFPFLLTDVRNGLPPIASQWPEFSRAALGLQSQIANLSATIGLALDPNSLSQLRNELLIAAAVSALSLKALLPKVSPKAQDALRWAALAQLAITVPIISTALTGRLDLANVNPSAMAALLTEHALLTSGVLGLFLYIFGESHFGATPERLKVLNGLKTTVRQFEIKLDSLKEVLGWAKRGEAQRNASGSPNSCQEIFGKHPPQFPL